MLPVSDSENLDTMQAGELERMISEEAVPPGSMTVTRDIATPQPRSLLSPPLPTDYKFKSEVDTSEIVSSDDEPDVQRPNCVDKLLLPKGDLFGKYHEQNPNESVRCWLQRITAMQNEIQRKHKMNHVGTAPVQPCPPSGEPHKTSAAYASARCATPTQHPQPQPPPPPPPATRVVKYQDLPYMGEMTLDNSKPRRGRKPKKADICHLIYKNYGTIFPGTPRSLVDTDVAKKTTSKHKEPAAEPLQRSNVQNRIISSLLEKRLTQESMRRDNAVPACPKTVAPPAKIVDGLPKDDQNEPLNLCIRDLNQLKIRLLRKHGNVYASDTPSGEVKSEPNSDDDVEIINDGSSPISFVRPPDPSLEDPSLLVDGNSKSPDVNVAPGGYVYWPNAGVFIHPMALHSHLMYYQRMAANNNYTLPSTTGKPPTEKVQPVESPKEYRKLVPKHNSRQEKEEPNETCAVDAKLKRIAPSHTNAPTKRKRSAIFIPPIPSENQTNPATEVSICKFKFTGGAKPSLQEKKMLSVDSGGNFRYYSGTGDKSMRGYEFFPRETLQQAGSSHGSSTGAFLQASGEKIPLLPPSNSPEGGKQGPSEFMFSPDVQLSPMAPSAELSPRHRKRKTRKSLQREKLEQTFKERGFLIQTQQLESAEGATYCKFRQLRKFTRYLFRSWKDYLPGNVRELQDGEKSDEEDGEHDPEISHPELENQLSPSINDV